MNGKLISKDSLIEKLDVFSDRKNGNEHFLNGIETSKELLEQEAYIDIDNVLSKLRKACRNAEEIHDMSRWGAYAYAISLLTEDEED